MFDPNARAEIIGSAGGSATVTSLTPAIEKRRQMAALLASPLPRAEFGISSAVWPVDVKVPQGDRHKRWAIPMSRLTKK